MSRVPLSGGGGCVTVDEHMIFDVFTEECPNITSKDTVCRVCHCFSTHHGKVLTRHAKTLARMFKFESEDES